MLSRQGLTLAELLVAFTLAAVVLGAATMSALRQQHTHARIVSTLGADAQIRVATQVLAGQLALLDPLAGDLVQGEAEDTVLQIRASVAQSIACQQETNSATFLPDVAGAVSLGGMASSPRAGDTLWWLADTGWLAGQITSVQVVTASCTNPVAAAGRTLRVLLSGNDTIAAGAPLRVTRQTRYGLYRSNGSWQFGQREWNDSTQRFPVPQPIVGPLLQSSAGRRTGFRYFDTAGTELKSSNGPINVKHIARIRVTALSVSAVRDRLQDSVRTDSLDVALLRATGP